jgi:hypothetical protein
MKRYNSFLEYALGRKRRIVITVVIPLVGILIPMNEIWKYGDVQWYYFMFLFVWGLMMAGMYYSYKKYLKIYWNWFKNRK